MLVFGAFAQLLCEGRFYVFLLLLIHGGLHRAGLGLDGGGLGAIGVGEERDAPLTGAAPLCGVERRLEDRAQAKIIDLRNRVVAMIVALGAADRQPQERRADNL